MNNCDFDVLIVGAGISGIGAAYHLQKSCPDKSFAILEGRETLGGTWDLFRYPGIRSDSDMYTLGFPFRPWQKPDKAIADGESILNYLRETAEEYGIDRKIRYRHRVEGARWSSDEGCWTIDVRIGDAEELTQFRTKFLFSCAGYYDYESGHAPEFAGRDRFQGRIVHPQFWTDDIDYAGKRVVVIGSGATAVTLVPELAKKAAHVTMLQRSPTYIASVPARDALAEGFDRWLPKKMSYQLTRWKNVLLGTAFYNYCRRYPERASRFLIQQVRKAVRGTSDVDTHFTPDYKPWDQRLCLVPDGDLFEAIREGRASVVTDHIDTFTEGGIRLNSGEQLDADLIVTATGLKMKFLGGVTLEVDGHAVDANETLLYKGIMLSDVPNLAICFGYTNASWTLKSDLTARYVCRLIEHMDRHRYTSCCPRADADAVDAEPLVGLSSGYVQRARHLMPRQGKARPWRLRENYALDYLHLRHSSLADSAMEFSRGRPAGARAPAPETDRTEPAEPRRSQENTPNRSARHRGTDTLEAVR